MRELGYRPNSAARALRYGQFSTIGVILFSLASTGNSRTLEAIATHAAAEGYAITLIPVDVPTQDNVLGAFTRMGELAVDAVIVILEVHLLDAGTVTLPPGRPRRRGRLRRRRPLQRRRHRPGRGHPPGRPPPARPGPPHGLARHRAAQLLRQPAPRRRPGAWSWSAAGRPVPPPLHGDWSAESGYAAGLALADRPDCTAVFAANDQMALGLLARLPRAGPSGAGRVSVVGFDDIPDAACFVPPLTTVHQDFAEVGRRCVEGALRQIREGGSGAPGTDLVPTRLVTRASTAPPNS